MHTEPTNPTALTESKMPAPEFTCFPHPWRAERYDDIFPVEGLQPDDCAGTLRPTWQSPLTSKLLKIYPGKRRGEHIGPIIA
jgi:hypothetical protein